MQSEEDVQLGRLRGVYVASNRPWWIEIRAPKDAPRESVYEHWVMLCICLGRAAPVLDKAYPKLPGAPITFIAKFDKIVGGTVGWLPSILVFPIGRSNREQRQVVPRSAAKECSKSIRGHSSESDRHGTICWLPYVTTFYYRLAIVAWRVRAYLQTMTYRNESSVAAMTTSQLHCTVAADTCKGATLMTSTLRTIFAMLALATISMAAELPKPPVASSGPTHP